MGKKVNFPSMPTQMTHVFLFYSPFVICEVLWLAFSVAAYNSESALC